LKLYVLVIVQCVIIIQDEDKVCGSDGVTYVNECVMRMTSCRNQKLIHAVSLSECGLFVIAY